MIGTIHFIYPVVGSLVGLVWEKTFIVVTTTLASGIKDVDSVFVSNNGKKHALYAVTNYNTCLYMFTICQH